MKVLNFKCFMTISGYNNDGGSAGDSDYTFSSLNHLLHLKYAGGREGYIFSISD